MLKDWDLLCLRICLLVSPVLLSEAACMETDHNNVTPAECYNVNDARRYHYDDVSELLDKFTSLLETNSDQAKRLLHVFEEIRRVILFNLSKSIENINRVSLVGSTAKGVSLPTTKDLDVIIFVELDHDQLIRRFAILNKILRDWLQTSAFRHSYITKQYDGFVIHAFKFRNVDVDLQLGVDMSEKTEEYDNDQIHHDETSYLMENSDVMMTETYNVFRTSKVTGQVKRTLRFINGSRQYVLYSRVLSSSTLEGLVEFTGSRSDYCRAIIRLAKLWSSVCHVDGFKRGRSIIIELFAIHAAEQTEIMNEYPDIVSGFKYFLRLITMSDAVKLFWTEYYSIDDIPRELLKKTNFVINPCSPFEDVIKGSGSKNLRKLHQHAQMTLRALEYADYQCTLKSKLFSIFNVGIDEQHTSAELCNNVANVTMPTMSRRRKAVGFIQQFVFCHGT
ncbi:hypothetical protein BSL78_26140 [Apostichopus japonicus]|uniref:2'-5'-oligoadenylate synthetase 1 domain-containing protein n=1 Tax=Stichopus japonicus TaxID=307972 RepID=A0A2G8JMN7_STIJA|nr:hypothetical protein BSL78_26140 [Apostichopus japonicus]